MLDELEARAEPEDWCHNGCPLGLLQSYIQTRFHRCLAADCVQVVESEAGPVAAFDTGLVERGGAGERLVMVAVEATLGLWTPDAVCRASEWEWGGGAPDRGRWPVSAAAGAMREAFTACVARWGEGGKTELARLLGRATSDGLCFPSIQDLRESISSPQILHTLASLNEEDILRCMHAFVRELQESPGVAVPALSFNVDAASGRPQILCPLTLKSKETLGFSQGMRLKCAAPFEPVDPGQTRFKLVTLISLPEARVNARALMPLAQPWLSGYLATAGEEAEHGSPGPWGPGADSPEVAEALEVMRLSPTPNEGSFADDDDDDYLLASDAGSGYARSHGAGTRRDSLQSAYSVSRLSNADSGMDSDSNSRLSASLDVNLPWGSKLSEIRILDEVEQLSLRDGAGPPESVLTDSDSGSESDEEEEERMTDYEYPRVQITAFPRPFVRRFLSPNFNILSLGEDIGDIMDKNFKLAMAHVAGKFRESLGPVARTRIKERQPGQYAAVVFMAKWENQVVRETLLRGGECRLGDFFEGGDILLRLHMDKQLDMEDKHQRILRRWTINASKQKRREEAGSSLASSWESGGFELPPAGPAGHDPAGKEAAAALVVTCGHCSGEVRVADQPEAGRRQGRARALSFEEKLCGHCRKRHASLYGGYRKPASGHRAWGGRDRRR